jgi:hypothetical protein
VQPLAMRNGRRHSPRHSIETTVEPAQQDPTHTGNRPQTAGQRRAKRPTDAVRCREGDHPYRANSDEQCSPGGQPGHSKHPPSHEAHHSALARRCRPRSYAARCSWTLRLWNLCLDDRWRSTPNVALRANVHRTPISTSSSACPPRNPGAQTNVGQHHRFASRSPARPKSVERHRHRRCPPCHGTPNRGSRSERRLTRDERLTRRRLTGAGVGKDRTAARRITLRGREQEAGKRREAPGVPGAPRAKSRRRPTLPGGLPPSTIGAGGLNFRVREGNGCVSTAMATGNQLSTWMIHEDSRASTNIILNPSPRPISTGRLNTLPCLHLRPINVMVLSRALPG